MPIKRFHSVGIPYPPATMIQKNNSDLPHSSYCVYVLRVKIKHCGYVYYERIAH